jgi:hypothetical protein
MDDHNSIPGRGKDFSLWHHVQICSRANPANLMGTCCSVNEIPNQKDLSEIILARTRTESGADTGYQQFILY